MEELGAMRVAPRGGEVGALLSPRGHGSLAAQVASQRQQPVGLGLAASSAREVAAERTYFKGNALFTDTLRRREEMLAKGGRAAYKAKGSPRFQDTKGLHLAPAAAPAAVTPAAPDHGSGPLSNSIAAVEHQYAWMDRALLDELTGIGGEELIEQFDEKKNRRLRAEMALWMEQSRQRVGGLHHGVLDPMSISPIGARKALKEGLRTPLELVRSEVKQRYPHRKHPLDAHEPIVLGEAPATAMPPFAEAAAVEAAARELPPMA